MTKVLYPCGQCLGCRVNQRSIWTTRLLLESTQHLSSAFVTLTYAEESVPLTNDGLQTLNPKHLQDFLKRFRKSLEPMRIRFLAVGEYGETTLRPHYHAILFGFSPCVAPQVGSLGCVCSVCGMVSKAWGLGRIHIGSASRQSMQYVAGYTTKKLTGGMGSLLGSRHPEFMRSSRRPGIGHDAMFEIASSFMKSAVADGPLPSAIRIDGKMRAFGPFLRKKLKEMVGYEASIGDDALAALKEDVQALFESKESIQTPGQFLAVKLDEWHIHNKGAFEVGKRRNKL